MEKFEKITFDDVVVEVTRRCNMSCSHCLRGDAQAVDIDLTRLDTFLDQCEVIGDLTVSGGEPTLYLDALQHLYDGICKRGVMLLAFEVISNGYIFDEQIVRILKDFSDLVWACNRLCRKVYKSSSRENLISMCRLGISLDKYHTDRDICMENYKRYKKALAGYVDVYQVLRGNDINGFGRSKSLLEKPADYAGVIDVFSKKRIEIFSLEHTKPICKAIPTESLELAHPNQKRVLCGVYLDVFGNLKSKDISSSDYDCIDAFPSICTVNDPIWDALTNYNHSRMNCTKYNESLNKNIKADEGMRHQLFQSAEYRKNNIDAHGEPLTSYKQTLHMHLNTVVAEKIRDEMVAARQEARKLFPDLPESELVKALPFSVEDVPSIVTLMGENGNNDSDDEIDQYINTPLKSAYKFTMEDDTIPVARKDLIRCYMRVLAQYLKKEANQEPYHFKEQGLFTKLEKLNHLYKAESKSVRCVRCQKVIRHDGRNIHCTEGSGGLICDYCGNTNHTIA